MDVFRELGLAAATAVTRLPEKTGGLWDNFGPGITKLPKPPEESSSFFSFGRSAAPPKPPAVSKATNTTLLGGVKPSAAPDPMLKQPGWVSTWWGGVKPNPAKLPADTSAALPTPPTPSPGSPAVRRLLSGTQLTGAPAEPFVTYTDSKPIYGPGGVQTVTRTPVLSSRAKLLKELYEAALAEQKWQQTRTGPRPNAYPEMRQQLTLEDISKMREQLDRYGLLAKPVTPSARRVPALSRATLHDMKRDPRDY